MNKTLISVIRLSLDNMPNETLAAAYAGFTGFRRITPANMAYRPFLDLELIEENGHAIEYDSLIMALSDEINSRLEAETFK